MSAKPPSTTRALVRARLSAHVALLGATSIHDRRVALRRARSELTMFRRVLDEDWVRDLSAELRWCSDRLGPARDAEVLVVVVADQARRLAISDRVNAADLGGHLIERRDLELARASLLFDDERYLALVESLAAAARSPRIAVDAGDRRARAVVGPLVDDALRRLRRAAAAVAETDPVVGDPGDLHRIRIVAKRARYAAETAAVVRPKRYAALVRRLAQLHEHLGDHHDAVVAQAWLRTSGQRVGGGELALVAGELAGLLRDVELDLAASWPRIYRRVDRAASELPGAARRGS